MKISQAAVRFIARILIVLMGSFCAWCSAQAATTNALDRVNFGDASSEEIHNFMPGTPEAQRASSGVGQYSQTYRAPVGSGNASANGSQVLAFTMACDPARQNYLTVKLWGSDPNCQMYLANTSNPAIDNSGGPPAYPNRFYYLTTPIPLSMTQGQTSVNLTLLFVAYYDRYFGTGINYLTAGQTTRPVYSAFTHIAPCFVPDSADVVGSAPTRTGQATLGTLTQAQAVSILQANRTAIFGSGNLYDTVLARQIPGGTAGAPKEVIGLDLLNTSASAYASANPNATPDQWRNKIANQNPQPGYCPVPDQLLGLLATAYVLPPFTDASGNTVSGLDHYHDATIIPKLVAAIDGCTYMQDSDGGLMQQASEWTGLTSTARTTGSFVGSTARQATVHGGGDLQGSNTYAVGWALIQILNDSTGTAALQPYLAQSYDADLNGGSMQRAYAWERLLFGMVNFYAYGTGGVESQNMFQMLGLYSSSIALNKLQALYPNASYVVSSSTYNSGNYLGTATPLQAAEMVMGLYPDTLRGVNPSPLTLTNYGMTSKGLGEAHGALSCGYDGEYGQFLPSYAPRFAQLAAWDANADAATKASFAAMANAAINAFDQFISPLDSATASGGTISSDGFVLAQEDFITYRKTFDINDQGGAFNLNAPFLAANPSGPMANACALRGAYLNTQYGLTPVTTPDSGDNAPGGSLNNLRELAAYESTVRSLVGVAPSALTPLPGEPGQPDYAWADVQSGAVAFINNGERFYMNANWNNYEANGSSFSGMPPSQIARIHDTTATVERGAQVYLPYNSATVQPDGNLSSTNLQGAYVVRYGDYLIALNNSASASSVALPAGYGQAKDLLSGTSYNLGATVSVAAKQAAIFWLVASATPTQGSGTPPTVATAASASPATVTAKTTALSVLGADSGGESGLTYTWALTGTPPAPVTFSANGTNAAKNTTATFAAAGTYNFTVVIRNANSLMTSSAVAVTVSQSLTSVGILPATVTLTGGQSQTFFGTGYDQFGAPMGTGQTLYWTLDSGVGGVNGYGVYTAPTSTSGVATVRVTVGALTATAGVTVLPAVGVFTGNQDVGSPARPGSTTLSGSTYTLNGAGYSIGSNSDQFQFAYQTLTGDGTITARVVSMTNTAANAQAGVMMRDSLDAGAPYALNCVTPSSGVSFQYRASANAYAATKSTTTGLAAPYWVRLARTGSIATAYISPDGATWTQLGTPQSLAIGSTVNVGLAVSSDNYTTLCTATFDNVSIVPAGASFFSDADIGGPSPFGSYSQSVAATASGGTTTFSGTETMTAGGTDIYSASDSFHFAYVPVIGNTTLTARVVSLAGGNAKAGVMVRNTRAAGSVEASMLLTPSNGGYFQTRTSTGGSTGYSLASGIAPPYWLRIVRSGSSFSAYTSTNGTTWVQDGATTGVTMNNTVYVGLALTSRVSGTATVATFDNVTLIGTVDAAPTVATQPAASVNNLSASLSVLGADDQGEANLTYTWYVLGDPPGTVSLSANGTNAAKNATATFGASGTYYLQAVIADASGNTVGTNVLTVVAGTVTPPLAPANLAATGGNTIVNLTWNPSGGATGYNVKRSTSSGGTYTTVSSNQTATSYNDTGLTNGTTYYYKVSAINSAGEGVDSSVVSAMPVAVTADWFTQLFTTNNTTSNTTFTFTPASNINKYVVSRQTGVTTFPTSTTGATAIAAGDDTSTQVTLTGGATVALYGVSYGSFYVGSNGYITFTKADTSYKASLTTHFNQPRISALFDDLDASSGGTVSYLQTADRVAVTYQGVPNYGVSNSNSFQIEMFFDGRIRLTFLAIADTGGLIGLSAGGGKPSGYTASNFSTYPAPPAAPTGFTATGGNAKVTLNWTASTGAATYNVKRATTSGGPYTTIASGITTTTYSDTGLTNGATYYYVVSAANTTVGEGPNSSQASASPVGILAAPTGLAAAGGNAQVALTWAASSGAASYSVYRNTTGSTTAYMLAASGITGTSYTDTGLTNGTTYYYAITVTNAGGESALSAQVSSTPNPPPAAPTSLSATPGYGLAALSWTPSASFGSNVASAQAAGLSAARNRSDSTRKTNARNLARAAVATNATGSGYYNVKRSATSGSGYVTIGTATGTSYNDATAVNGTAYYYVVTAVLNGLESAVSNQAAATPINAAAWNDAAAGTQSWLVTGNWLNVGAVPSSTGLAATIGANIASDQTVNLNQVINLASLTLGDADATNAFTVAAGAGGSLAFLNGGGGASITQLSTSRGDTVSAPVTLSENLGLTNNSTAYPLTISGAITENAAGKTVTISGGGATVLAGANTYTGLTTVSAGTAKAGSATNGTTSGPFGGQNNALTLASGATLDLNGVNVGVGTFSGVGTVTNSATGTAASLTVGNNNSRMTGLSTTIFTGNVNLVVTGINATRDDFGASAPTNTHTGGVTYFANNLNDRVYNGLSFGSGPLTFGSSGGFVIPSSSVTNVNPFPNPVAVIGTGNVLNFQTAVASSGAWMGTGTLTIYQSFAPTFKFSGNLSGFQGTLVLQATGSTGGTNLAATYALNTAAATFDGSQAVWTLQSLANTYGGTPFLQTSGVANQTVKLGDLNTAGNAGTGAITVRNNVAGTTTFEVGALGATSTYGGLIVNGSTASTMITALRKIGTGTWTLTGANTFTGGTAVNQGTLVVGNTSGSGLGTGPATVGSGGTLRGSGTVSGLVTVSGGGTLAPGANAGSTGTLSCTGGLTLNGGSTLSVSLADPATAETIAVGGTYTGPASGTVTINVAGLANYGAGTYPVLTGASGINASSFTVGTSPVGYLVTPAVNGNTLSLVVTAWTPLQSWRYGYFGTAMATGTAADGADPDGDGISNLVEYATGRNPTVPDASQVTTLKTSTDGTKLVLEFNRIADPSLTYQVMACDDLTNWQVIWSSSGAQNIAGTVDVSDTESISAHTRRFLKLSVTH